VSIAVQCRCRRTRSWDLTWLADEGVSGAVPPESRKRFKAVHALLDADESGALIFTKVDRASRCYGRRRPGALEQDGRPSGGRRDLCPNGSVGLPG